mgnify:CR=1 FL=1
MRIWANIEGLNMEILIVLGILIILIVIKNNKSSDDMPGIAKAYEDLQSLPTMEKNIAETYICLLYTSDAADE